MDIREQIYNILEKEADKEIDGIKVWVLYGDDGEIYFDITTIDNIDSDEPHTTIFTLEGDSEDGIGYYVTVEANLLTKKISDWFDLDKS